MDKKILNADAFSLLCNIREDFTLSERFQEFLSRDNQGIEGLDFMIKDSRLCRRIPADVRAEYEIIRAKTLEDLDVAINSAIKHFQKLLNDDDKKLSIIHHFIQLEYERKK